MISTLPTVRPAELGRAIKTLFLYRYLGSEPLRAEINDGLNVVENWEQPIPSFSSARAARVATNRLEDRGYPFWAYIYCKFGYGVCEHLMIQQVWTNRTGSSA